MDSGDWYLIVTGVLVVIGAPSAATWTNARTSLLGASNMSVLGGWRGKRLCDCCELRKGSLQILNDLLGDHIG